MNPRQRLLAATRGEKPERVPLIPSDLYFASREDIDRLPDPRRREIAHRVHDQVAFHVCCSFFGNRYLMTPRQFIAENTELIHGTRRTIQTIHTPKGDLTSVVERHPETDTVWTAKYPVESLEDIEKIRSVPWEIPSSVQPPAFDNLPGDFETRCYTKMRISSPMVCVAGMMPYDYFLELCGTHLDLIRDLTAICTERTLDSLRLHLSRRNIEYVWMGGCEWLTPPMGSAMLYEELVQGPEKVLIDEIHAAGAICHIHCHGRMRSTLERVIARGADLVEPMEPPPDGDITMAEAKQIARGKITLAGNIEARILENEAPEVVEQAVRAAFEGGKERLVLQPTAGPIGAMTERCLANYHRMVDVWEEISEV